jgi:NAD(P)-dependent dehydrogenase (short-subunit alcohol dehydrogenase family)
MAQQLLERADVELLTMSRKPQAGLAGTVTQWAIDLTRPLEAASRLEDWLRQRDGATFASATLINNAALMAPLAPVDDNENALLSDAIRVGLEAPVLLTASFLRATRSWPNARRVLNISSGLGRRAMAGSAPYCGVKAGLDNFSCSVSLDEASRTNGARIVSLAPGVIDTDMQLEMRSADASKFPDRERLVNMKANGKLDTPEAAAAKVLACLDRADFGSVVLADVRA